MSPVDTLAASDQPPGTTPLQAEHRMAAASGLGCVGPTATTDVYVASGLRKHFLEAVNDSLRVAGRIVVIDQHLQRVVGKPPQAQACAQQGELSSEDSL